MNNKLPKIISVFVAIGGISAMVGWFWDIPILKSVFPQFVTMKFTTAVCFVLSGITLYGVAEINRKKTDGLVLMLMFVNFTIILIMVSLIIALFAGIKTGLEDLFIKEPVGAVNTLVPGQPSLLTMLLFATVAGMGFLSLFEKCKHTKKLIITLGGLVAFFGSMVIVGYITAAPWLLGQFGGISTAVALNTAILFVLLGVSFMAIYRKNGQDDAKYKI